MGNNAGRKSLEQGQELVSNPRAEKSRVIVGRILHRGDLVTRQVRTHLRIARSNHGAQ
jgi:plasmid stabilization system protein ParE